MSNIENISLSAEKHLNLAKKTILRSVALGIILAIVPAIIASRYIRSKFKQDRPMADKIRSYEQYPL
ncbi:hypothetical protein A3A14_02545 [Candidatus Daviesbacteria bacterium RIFCSPLOWO2_01_FULL_43_38]|uniref:Uncharacterized protein n=1 Tax=Candidatus Daviesbacteria bacterium RIFCSPHIGHO2_12_FULL_43_11 TaxID=1797780 RepID=A0A1F5K4Z2_9BACT|nr:MAG: hypothetical protein A2874_00935 [Candidatus Daviesbacteria bacterium RIFCSPHIGHO2_01_FULL_43_17]OGE35781.1 MAG: hypothetical protein A3E45_00620 [Candidatus Daviesbacteria bacterium RIFCSPHIGHO2_12_FULL_43_11]OGE63207.1 MAG: hypothetical protein A3A14_02545 [Candidatus Daviesbacteria bacterium RIFCSPLOWO2_01_FULL_43_38]OGE69692.1 MAG: hypothetical protein A3J21_03330 [Candidatus Daviesbacteria bacterium RIFCSPLOWO2_02_FULL_43_11]